MPLKDSKMESTNTTKNSTITIRTIKNGIVVDKKEIEAETRQDKVTLQKTKTGTVAYEK